ncbi:inhibitor of Bruton tyrosine kinase-like isoform X2 [Eriocheir sinensis]|uniref:inhibitor of Bruton tyrosine kinase-like isoform X2 n=1 Tax=Eriocheir sinensis TaxID=95602 RepID=UPI0021C8BFBE|nr:inhibitor of Bruton tyrosine kinase-like isoform X2 [Eriocheir sinensis]
MGRCEVGECTQGCRSRQHGAQITAAIIRGTETQAVAYMKNLCQRFYSVTDATGKTALHTAASCGKRRVVKWLMSHGSPLNQRDWESGYTPLHRALFYGHLGTACTLIQAGSSTSTLDNDALTPLDHINFDRARSMSFTSSRPTQVYLWGNNTNFNLGQTSQQARGTPECLDIFHREGHKISDVVLNKFHTLFLTTGGRVYTCGHGQGGRLGLDTNAPVITPRPIKAFTHINVIKIASGTHHSLFLTDAGQAVASESISMPLPTSILTVILDYLYEDDASKLWQCHDTEFLCNVLVVADQFLITRLRELCEKAIAGLLTLKNAAELLEFAAGYNAVGLKTTIMQFLCQNLVAVLENGTLLSSVSQERLQELSEYYRSVNDCMSYRIMTPHDVPPDTKDLQHNLDENPFILQESDEEMEGTFHLKDEKAFMSGGTPGSSRKKKRQHRNSQGDGRHRKPSTSSSVCSSDYDQKELEEEFENMSFDDLEERKQSPVGESVEVETTKEETNSLTGNVLKNWDKDITQSKSDNASWQKVKKKKSTSSQPVSITVKSPVQSPAKENTCLDIFQSAGITRQNSQDTNTYSNVSSSSRVEESSFPKFPSLQESISTAQRTVHTTKNSKIQKLSQKQRKRLISETANTPPPDKVKVPPCPWGSSSPAWGKEKGTEDTSSDTSSLANIMMSEMTKVKKNSIPINIPDNKNRPTTIIQNKNGGTPSNSYKDQESVAWSAVTPSPTSTINSPPLNNNGQLTIKATSSDCAAPSFTHILMEEETRSDNLLRERSKPLSLIQVEDRAIEELLAFYGAGECFEERITVTRVRGSIANPTWSK